MAAATIPFDPTVPFMGDITQFIMTGPVLSPMEYTGWRSEQLAWKESAYLGTSLAAASPTFVVKGPDALRFFQEQFVNDFSTLKVGGFRHGIMLDEHGRILQDGVVIRIADDEYYTMWLWPTIEYRLSQGSYDAEGVNLTGQRFLFQVAGPKSLEILERAAQADLHDIKFGQHRLATIAGKQVRVFRLGMAGSLAYEVHGDTPDAQDVYLAIWGAGAPMGMKKLGLRAYMMNHTEDGFPQAYYHFPYPWYEEPGLAAFLDARPFSGWMEFNPRWLGSLEGGAAKRFVNVFDVGWENRVDWSKDFTGKAALEKIAAGPTRTVVTLEWNADDLAEVYSSQFRGEDVEPFDFIEERPNDEYYDNGTIDPATGAPKFWAYHADAVLAPDGREVGMSTGRSVSQAYRRMISLGFIEREQAVIGNELLVVWGAPGHPQKRVRTIVARFPYLQVERNDKVDVETIPRYREAEPVG